MKPLIAGAVLVMLASPAVAQTTAPNPNGSSSAEQNANGHHNLLAARKIKEDMQKAGFTDVKVVSESFVVQAKSKDGDPVLMTIGPHGMSVFEAMNNSGKSSSTTGSSTLSQSGGTSSSQQSQRPTQDK